ncbi:uncharacterized protein LOC142198026 [Leptodactylus fuscus]|uniref:uncharacterized protein LOC142198026 n=1 Tax=Leptodactylus fuscus TaxID=238119 RepID=UPI003F4E9B2E
MATTQEEIIIVEAAAPAPAETTTTPGEDARKTATGAASPEASPKPVGPGKPKQGPPALEPWMRQTVVLKLREVNGRRPDLTEETFCQKMLAEQGFSLAETLSVQAFMTGLFYVTFVSTEVCRRYWNAVKSAVPGSPFATFVGNCPIQRDERRITITMRNPHTPAADIFTFLNRFCTVIREPSPITNKAGYWTGKWSAIVKLGRDSSRDDGVRHLPPVFSLGNSQGLIFYPDMPHTCRKCSAEGHEVKDCTAGACRNCRVAGHETKDCLKAKTCNLCGLAGHVYKDCDRRSTSYAGAAKRFFTTVSSARAAAGPAKAPQGQSRARQNPRGLGRALKAPG